MQNGARKQLLVEMRTDGRLPCKTEGLSWKYIVPFLLHCFADYGTSFCLTVDIRGLSAKDLHDTKYISFGVLARNPLNDFSIHLEEGGHSYGCAIR